MLIGPNSHGSTSPLEGGFCSSRQLLHSPPRVVENGVDRLGFDQSMRGRSSAVEHHVANVRVVSSNLIVRFSRS